MFSHVLENAGVFEAGPAQGPGRVCWLSGRRFKCKSHKKQGHRPGRGWCPAAEAASRQAVCRTSRGRRGRRLQNTPGRGLARAHMYRPAAAGERPLPYTSRGQSRPLPTKHLRSSSSCGEVSDLVRFPQRLLPYARQVGHRRPLRYVLLIPALPQHAPVSSSSIRLHTVPNYQ